ncbi:MAG: DNA replication/repair protein RecF [Rhodospirillaceae bacterium]|nr:DNA replication/repair protein RecF [Rhodospirillaceae bacterium]
MCRIAVIRLKLLNFRCYKQLSLDTRGRMVVLSGPNGAGKTNLLEAVSFLVPGRGMRRARLSEPVRGKMDNFSENDLGYWSVSATIEDRDGHFDVGTGVKPSTNKDYKRIVHIDGDQKQSQSSLAERISMLWLTPDMQRLFTDGASGRRRFLDRMVFSNDPAHAIRIQEYEKALRNRSRVLSDARREHRLPDSGWLDALETNMVKYGVAIAAARANLVRRLNPACMMGIGPFPAAGLNLSGSIDCWLSEMPAVEVEENFNAELRRRREEDSILRGASQGPHKTDLKVQHLDHNAPAKQCSTGEQKALLLSIVLANARLQRLDTGFVPILLLDDVAAHLDEIHREALFEELIELDVQAWMTGTDPLLFSSVDKFARHFTVANAAVSQLN